VQQAIATKRPQDDELFVIHDKTLLLRTVPILDEKRDVSGILRFGLDISALYAKFNEISE
jgi:sensor histidine kinase regulating citrate/malate metabolism